MKFKEISELKLTEQIKIDVDEARKEKGIPLSKVDHRREIYENI